MKGHRIYLQHILEAITSIENFVLSKTLKNFEEDDLFQSAVIRKFEIIGEAAKEFPII